MLEHGGRLQRAARKYDIPVEQWLDLSTGINPNGWSVPPIPASQWARLPEDDDGLMEAAQSYYDTEHLLPVAGSQAAIQALPGLFNPPVPVGILEPGYAEHAHAWQRRGFNLIPLPPDRIDESVSALHTLVVIHPNNPTGNRFKTEKLLEWHLDLVSRGCWLVVDEAFMDCTPELSLLPYAGQKGLIVLRSMGKFFGLAGARVGFVAAPPDVLEQLRDQLGPWALSGPARYVARRALQDKDWQTQTRRQLALDGPRLKTLLSENELAPSGGCELFQWVKSSDAKLLHETLARQGILTRLFATPSSLRFGLPGTIEQWHRLENALNKIHTHR